MRVSEWLAELSSHDIYDAEGATADFMKRTGEADTGWPTCSAAGMKQRIHARGLGGSINLEDPARRMIAGYEIAEHLAAIYADGFTSSKMGRGFIFDDCLRAIREAEAAKERKHAGRTKRRRLKSLAVTKGVDLG